MALLDQFGRPVRQKVLTQTVAEPGITSVRQAFAGTVASGLTPQSLAGILRACDDGEMDQYLVLAEEMEERDPHYFSVLGMRKRAVSGVVATVKPASESAQDVKIADEVRENIAEHDGYTKLVEDILDALGKGFSATEIIWGRSSSEWWFEEFVHRPARFFQFDRDTGRELRLRDEADLFNGVELDPFKWVVHNAQLKSGLAARGGLARVVAFSWMCKAYTLKDWMAFIETYGLPLRMGRYGSEATPKDVEKLFQAVANIGTDAAAVLPKSMEIEFTDTASSTGDKVFENLARYVDEQTSKAVLGQTMTSDDGSSNAQAQVHNDVRHDIAVADARAVTGTINRDLVKPYVDVNFGVQKAYPRLLIEVVEPEDTDMIMRNVFRMSSQGTKFKATEVRSKLGFTDPDDDDEVIGETPTPPATNTALNRAQGTRPDQLDDLEVEMLEDWEEVMGDLLEPVEDTIASADSYEDALERLAKVLPNMGPSKLIEGLVKGMFKARALGDVKDG